MKPVYIITVAFLLAVIFPITAQDLIILRDGNVIEAKVLEIHPSEIRYKRFDHLDGPTIVISAADVLSIRYENGMVETINFAQTPLPPIQDSVQQGSTNLATITLQEPLWPGAVPSSSTVLVNGQWIEGYITSSGRERWYSFNVTRGTTYYIWLEDGSQVDNGYLMYVNAGAYYSNGASVFTDIIPGSSFFISGNSFTASSNSTVYIMVIPDSRMDIPSVFNASTATGSFTISYGIGTSSIKPNSTNIATVTRQRNSLAEDAKFYWGFNANAGGLLLGGTSFRIELGKGKFNTEINLIFPSLGGLGQKVDKGFGVLLIFNGFWPNRIGGFYLGGGMGIVYQSRYAQITEEYIFSLGANIGFKFITSIGLCFRVGGYLGVAFGGYAGSHFDFRPDLSFGWNF